jgi:hypothetical protein
MTRLALLTGALALPLLLAGCGSAPRTVSLGKTYTMVDEDGRTAGKVTFSPLGDGQVFDAQGNLIGHIVKP